MTLIAGIKLQDAFVIVGDTMLSNIFDIGSTYLPFTGRIASKKASSPPTRFVSGLCQKVCLVTPQVVVAWAGNHMVAKSIITALKHELRYPGDAAKILKHNLADYSSAERESVSLILAQMQPLDADISRVSLRLFGEFTNYRLNIGQIFTAGSGEFDFGDLMIQYLSNDSMKSMLFDSKYRDSRWMSIACAVAHRCADEFFSMETGKLFYGGAYEIINMVNTNTSNSFRKLSNIAYAFWLVSKDNKDIHLDLAGDILCQWYDEDLLYLMRYNFVGSDDESPQVTIIPPPWHSPINSSTECVMEVDFKSIWTINIVIFKVPDGVTWAVYILPDHQMGVNISGKEASLSIVNEVYETLLSLAQRIYDK